MSDIEAIVFKNCRQQNLVGILHHGKGQAPRPCLIACHGFVGTKVGGSKRYLLDFARYAVEYNLSVFRFDFAGCGDSDGKFADLTITTELEDLQAAINLVSTAAGIDSRKIGLFGPCLGAVTAIIAGSRDPRIYRVVAWAPFANFATALLGLVGAEAFKKLQQGKEAEFKYSDQPFQCGAEILSESSNLDMFQEITRLQKPLLIIHGTEDAVVPLQEVQELIHCAREMPGERKLVVIEGAHHSFPYHLDQVYELTAKWFIQYE